MKIEEYSDFVENEWVHFPAKEDAYQASKKAYEDTRKRIDEEIRKYLSQVDSYEKELERLIRHQRTIEKNKGILDDAFMLHGDIVQNLDPLPEKTDKEKAETDIEDEANRLNSEIAKNSKQMEDHNHALRETIGARWARFIGMGALPFDSNLPIDNAKRIIEIDDMGEMGIFADKTFQKVNLAIGGIASHQSALQDTYDEVRGAISKVNRDLEDISSTALIESIQLREQRREGGVIEKMKYLSDYWNTNYLNMQQSLFSQETNDKYREEIMARLDSFLYTLSTLSTKEKNISAGSLFDLQGKVVEKGNATDWGDRVFNSGSEGTQFLIKVSITASLFAMALTGSKDQQIPYLIIDEIGKLDEDNVQRILQYINTKGSYLIAIQPNDNMAKYFNRAYNFKDEKKDKTVIEEYLRNKIPLVLKD